MRSSKTLTRFTGSEHRSVATQVYVSRTENKATGLIARALNVNLHFRALPGWLLAMEAWWELLRAAILVRIPLGRQKMLEQALNTGKIARGSGNPTTGDRGGMGMGQLHFPLVPVSPGVPFVKAVNRARRWQPKSMNCLEQSLALVWMLRRRGLAARLQIACRRNGAELRFHAWVAGPDSTPLVPSEKVSPFTPLAFASCNSGVPA